MSGAMPAWKLQQRVRAGLEKFAKRGTLHAVDVVGHGRIYASGPTVSRLAKAVNEGKSLADVKLCAVEFEVLGDTFACTLRLGHAGQHQGDAK